jgi:hypothetical protein
MTGSPWITVLLQPKTMKTTATVAAISGMVVFGVLLLATSKYIKNDYHDD